MSAEGISKEFVVSGAEIGPHMVAILCSNGRSGYRIRCESVSRSVALAVERQQRRRGSHQ